jgi:hypothetical protein
MPESLARCPAQMRVKPIAGGCEQTKGAAALFDDIPLHILWIFPGDEPGDHEADQVAPGVEWGGRSR